MNYTARVSQDNCSVESEWRTHALALMDKTREALSQAQDLSTIRKP